MTRIVVPILVALLIVGGGTAALSQHPCRPGATSCSPCRSATACTRARTQWTFEHPAHQR